MPDCDRAIGGALLIGIAIYLLYLLSLERHKIRLARSLPFSPCGSVPDGMVQIFGRTVGNATLTSPLSGLPCLMYTSKVDVYFPERKKRKWQNLETKKESVSFHVEDSTGRVWMDPGDADFLSGGGLQLTTNKKGKASTSLHSRMQQAEATWEAMEARLREIYVRHHYSTSLQELSRQSNDLADRTVSKRAQQILKDTRKRTIRGQEAILSNGDLVCVIGPAYQQPATASSPHPVIVRKVHPDDSFVIGIGEPAQVHTMLRKKARNLILWCIGLFLVGAWMVWSC